MGLEGEHAKSVYHGCGCRQLAQLSTAPGERVDCPEGRIVSRALRQTGQEKGERERMTEDGELEVRPTKDPRPDMCIGGLLNAKKGSTLMWVAYCLMPS